MGDVAALGLGVDARDERSADANVAVTSAAAGVGFVRVRVRYFAAAKAAAGVGEETRTVDSGCSIAGLLDEAGFAGVPVFGRSTFLLNGVTTTDRAAVLRDGDELDVLPPFAGG